MADMSIWHSGRHVMPDISICDMSILDISAWSMSQMTKRLVARAAGLGIQPAGISAAQHHRDKRETDGGAAKARHGAELCPFRPNVNTPDVAAKCGNAGIK